MATYKQPCIHCGEMIMRDDRSCGKCGQCGFENPPGTKFCGDCGNSLQ